MPIANDTTSCNNTDANAWLQSLLGSSLPPEGGRIPLSSGNYVMRAGILRSEGLVSDSQKQTSEAFAFKWEKRDTYESAHLNSHVQKWLEKYGDISSLVDSVSDSNNRTPVVLDAGCGSGVTGFELFSSVFDRIHYLGVDVSEAVDVALQRSVERDLPNVAFMQSDLLSLPLAEKSVDILYSEGVLHHTDSTERALKKVTTHLRTGGLALFYVYKKKGPIREFTDDYVRQRINSLSPAEAWDKLYSLSKLGAQLGALKIELNIEEPIEVLDIPAGTIDLQRFFYWHVFKAFYREDFSIDEMHHINYDWFAPVNAHRQTPEQVRQWCREAGLEIEREVIEDAGITIVGRKR